jgi:hypothetical protein
MGGMLGAGVEFAFMDFGTRTYTFTIAPADVSFSEPLTPKSGRTSTWSKSA